MKTFQRVMSLPAFSKIAFAFCFGLGVFSTNIVLAAASKPNPALLIRAVESNDLTKAQILLTNKVDVNFMPRSGMNALMTAAYDGKVEMCKLLIANGAVAQRDRYGYRMESYLSSSTHKLPETVKKEILELLKNNTNQLSNTAFAQNKKVSNKRGRAMLKEVLEQPGIEINKPDRDGKTALMEAAADGDADTCRLLISKGADVSLKDSKQKTAFDYVCSNVKNPSPALKERVRNALQSSKPATPK